MISHLETEITISGARVPVVVLFSLEEGGSLQLLETKIRPEHICTRDKSRLLALAQQKVAEMRAGPDMFSARNPILSELERSEAERLSNT